MGFRGQSKVDAAALKRLWIGMGVILASGSVLDSLRTAYTVKCKASWRSIGPWTSCMPEMDKRIAPNALE